MVALHPTLWLAGQAPPSQMAHPDAQFLPFFKIPVSYFLFKILVSYYFLFRTSIDIPLFSLRLVFYVLKCSFIVSVLPYRVMLSFEFHINGYGCIIDLATLQKWVSSVV